jgi:hypothetical protein
MDSSKKEKCILKKEKEYTIHSDPRRVFVISSLDAQRSLPFIT